MHKMYTFVTGLLLQVMYASGLHAAANNDGVRQGASFVSSSSQQTQTKSSRPRLPERFYASIERAKTLYQEGKWSEALALAERIALNEKQELRDRADSLTLAGDIYRQGGNGIERNLQRALEKYRSIWRIAGPRDLGPSYFWRINGKISRLENELQAQEGLQLLQSALPTASSSSGVGLVDVNSAAQLLAQADTYLDGAGDILPDHAKALNLYFQVLGSPDRSDVDMLKAYGGIADIYLVGTHGVPVDHKKALEYFEKAFALAQAIQNAEQIAIYSAALGGLHFIGGEGIEKDYSKALDAYAYAIENAHLLPAATRAIMYFNLGDMYNIGQTGMFARDLQQALSYYNNINVPDLTYSEAAKLANRMREIYEFRQDLVNALAQAKKYNEYLQAWLRIVDSSLRNDNSLSQEQIDENWQTYYKIESRLKENKKKIQSLQSALRKRSVRPSDQTGSDKRKRTLRGVQQSGLPAVEEQALPEASTSTLLQDDEMYTVSESPSFFSSPSSRDASGLSSQVLLDDEPVASGPQQMQSLQPQPSYTDSREYIVLSSDDEPMQRNNQLTREKPLLWLESSSDEDSNEPQELNVFEW